MMAVPISTEGGLTFGRPQKLFESADLLYPIAVSNYDVSADGQRFITITAAAAGPAALPKIRIVENWHEEFRNREERKKGQPQY